MLRHWVIPFGFIRIFQTSHRFSSHNFHLLATCIALSAIIMKVSALTVLAMSAPAMASEFSLRGLLSKTFLAPAAKETTAEARIIIQGLNSEDTSAEDVAIINDSIVAAYNKAYQSAGYFMEALETTADLQYPSGWDCRLCPPDDDTTAAAANQVNHMMLAEFEVTKTPAMVGADLGLLHQRFERDFCHALRTSGSPTLVHARRCTFSFLASASTENLPIQGKSSEAQVNLPGLLNEGLTEEDLKTIDETIVSAYNEAFVGFPLESFASIDYLQYPSGWDCRLCPPDDDTLGATTTQMIFAQLTYPSGWDCRLCPPDDDALPVDAATLANMHDRFEETLCAKLQNSGVENFAHVHDCRFLFVENPGDAAVTAEQ